MIKKVCSTLFILCLVYSVSHGQWTELFNGTDLSGWKQVGGSADYQMVDGILIGTAVPNTPNSFLTTERAYGDFILELDVYFDTQLNSGIQIRSHSDPQYRNGAFHGYQVEIDPSARAWSGGIYDESRRGWMYPLSRNTKANSAIRSGQWNKVRIEAIGSSINTWINGIQCARLIDDLTATGHIGLQVHSIGGEELDGAQIKWRNIRILTENLESEKTTADPVVEEISYLNNQLTEWEKRNGFRLLWDGKSTKGWRGAKLDDFPDKGWKIDDGILTVLAGDGGESTGGGDIVTEDMYSNFELELEFRITEGANSGIKYYVDPTLNKGSGSAIGCEFQILDDQRHPDAKMGVNGNRTVGSLYDLITAENLSVASRSKQFKGIGNWNKARIVAKNGKVEHWLNNEKTVEYDRHSQLFKALVAYSKYAKWDNFGRWPEGSILLQDHGDEVSFRSIKIRELN